MNKQKNTKWARLDNAAKIFPSTSGNRDTKVFRFSCSLFTEVVPESLQIALDNTLLEFPAFLCIMRRGLFWYYFEETTRRPVVKEEDSPPCGKLYYKNKKTLLFEVTYYKKRINFEVYHSLTDGTGALEFMRHLVCNYIYEEHERDFSSPPQPMLDASATQKESDSFNNYYTGESGSNANVEIKRACRVSGLRFSGYRFRVIEGLMPMKTVIDAAHRYGATVSVYLTAVLISSIGMELSVMKKRRPVVISIPVNLRNFFSSGSMRNFFSRFSVSYDFSQKSGEFEDIVQKVKQDYRDGLSLESLQQRLNMLASYEHKAYVRFLPLFLKDIVLKNINKVSALGLTATISNIGGIKMPDGFERYIQYFSIFISPGMPQICLCSYNSVMSVGFTSPYISSEIEKNFYRKLSADGVEIEINSIIPNRD